MHMPSRAKYLLQMLFGAFRATFRIGIDYSLWGLDLDENFSVTKRH